MSPRSAQPSLPIRTSRAEPPAGPEPAAPERRRLPRWLRWILLGLGTYILVATIWLASAILASQQGLDALQAVGQDLSAENLLDGTGVDRIHAAEDDFETAHGRASSPFLAPIHHLPVIGRQVRSFATMSGAASDVAAITADGAEEGTALVQGGVPAGPERVEVLRALSDIADRAAARLAVVDVGSGEALIGPIAGAHEAFVDRKDGLEDALLSSRDVSDALATVFDGPTRYLLLAANNAEMRAGSGMFLSAGVMTFDDGDLDLGDMEPTGDLVLPAGVGTTDAAFEELWGFASPDRDYRNLALTPRFPIAGEQAARMWEAGGGVPVDGVMVVDAVGLQALLAATGPVQVDDTQVNEHNVVGFLMHDQYLGAEGNEVRRDRLSDVARAAVNRLDEVDVDAGVLARSMRDAGSGRHLMLWSAEERLERAWERSGLAGDVGARSLLLSVQNQGANKLDQFLVVDARLDLGEPVDGTLSGTLTVEVANTTPPGEPTYVAGPNTPGVEAGEYVGWLTLHLPEAVGAEVVSGPPATVTGAEGVSHVLVSEMRLLPGDATEWVVQLELPESMEALTIEPSGRIPPIVWSVRGEEWSDDTTPRRTIDL